MLNIMEELADTIGLLEHQVNKKGHRLAKQPPRPGLVPQSGDPQHPGRWVLPAKPGGEPKQDKTYRDDEKPLPEGGLGNRATKKFEIGSKVKVEGRNRTYRGVKDFHDSKDGHFVGRYHVVSGSESGYPDGLVEPTGLNPRA